MIASYINSGRKTHNVKVNNDNNEIWFMPQNGYDFFRIVYDDSYDSLEWSIIGKDGNTIKVDESLRSRLDDEISDLLYGDYEPDDDEIAGL